MQWTYGEQYSARGAGKGAGFAGVDSIAKMSGVAMSEVKEWGCVLGVCWGQVLEVAYVCGFGCLRGRMWASSLQNDSKITFPVGKMGFLYAVVIIKCLVDPSLPDEHLMRPALGGYDDGGRNFPRWYQEQNAANRVANQSST